MRTFPFTVSSAVSLPALITIVRATQTFRFTTHHSAITVGASIWEPGPGAMVTNVQFPSDGSPATADVMVMATTGGIVTPGDAARGYFDNWPISIAVVDPDNTAAGSFDLIPNATIGNVVEDTRGLTTFSVNGPLNRTRKQVTEHYALTCRADLYDSRCKVVRADFTNSVTGQATSNFIIKFDSLPDARGSDPTWYVMGLIALTSGPLSGFPDIPIRAWNPSTLEATLFLPVALTDVPAGTTMDISAGCDLTREQCFSRFNNIVNLRAETFVPPSNIITAF